MCGLRWGVAQRAAQQGRVKAGTEKCDRVVQHKATSQPGSCNATGELDLNPKSSLIPSVGRPRCCLKGGDDLFRQLTPCAAFALPKQGCDSPEAVAQCVFLQLLGRQSLCSSLPTMLASLYVLICGKPDQGNDSAERSPVVVFVHYQLHSITKGRTEAVLSPNADKHAARG